jgi:glycosyltransferase involved in cell wall biosynthesis
MRILYLNHNVKWISTFHRCFQFGKQLVKLGHSVDLITISPKRRRGFEVSMLDGVKIIESPDILWGMGRSGWDFWDTFNRLVYLRKQPYDLVHAFDSRPNVIYPALAKKREGSVLISDWADWWGRGGVVEERSNWLLRTFFTPIETHFEEDYRKFADGMTVISRALQGRAEALGFPATKIERISGGADIDSVKPLPKQEMREKWGVPASAKVVGFAGVVHYDIDLLLKSFEYIDNSVENAVMLIAGKTNPEMMQMAQSGRFKGKIMPVGMVEFKRLQEFLACCDVLALPFANKIANVGRWPNKVGDYLSAARPVVSNPTGDIKGLFEEENIGLLAQSNPEDFAAKIVELLNDPTRCKEFGYNARIVAEKRLDWAVLTRQLDKFYQRFTP